jgi:hypothetical protein
MYVKSLIRTLQASLFTLVLTTTATLHAQTIQQIAVLDLPEAPLPQAPTQQPAQSSSQQAPAPVAQVPPVTPSGSSSSSQEPPAPSAADKAKQQHDEAESELKVEEKQRLLGVMPQFQVVMGGQAVPLSAGQKWRLALRSAIDPFYIGWALVIGGGYGEIVDSDTGYGWGANGYIKRVGANYADNVNGAIIGNALLPSILHQDPRYFRKGTGSFKSRFVHAALSTVICHGDNGKNQPNVSNVLGNYISGAISNLYYPAEQRGVALTLQNGTSVTLFGALGGQILEFGPDLTRILTKKRHPPAPTADTLQPTVPSNDQPQPCISAWSLAQLRFLLRCGTIRQRIDNLARTRVVQLFASLMFNGIWITLQPVHMAL